ncbi:unnamed protein product [Enterobius vermicularis]|uniref:Protein C10 n=1 Tax=Enterobius vermicularis TaxID=51028 RepID=A0A0N4VIE3_ENTVE|nr:unnamed protein product [Enterobius vermicularis]
MSSFVTLLDSICPPFRDFVSDFVQNELKRQQKRSCIFSEEQVEKVVAKSVGPPVHDLERFEAQRRQIQEALNQQTYHQFRAYAQQQFVGDPVQVG